MVGVIVIVVIAGVARVIAQCLDEEMMIVNAEGIDNMREGTSRSCSCRSGGHDGNWEGKVLLIWYFRHCFRTYFSHCQLDIVR